jgi:hypothetical protein
MRGWLKYFTYIPSEEHTIEDKPEKFDYNEEWLDQEKIDGILDESSETETEDEDSDSEGGVELDPTKIPDDTHFYFLLTKSTLFSLSHFSNSITKTVKSLEIDWI